MTQAKESSRQRYAEYRQRLSVEHRDPKSAPAETRDPMHKRLSRSAWTLIREFWGLMDRQKPAMITALACVTVATLLGLVPPAATKFIIDYVVGNQALPADWLRRFPLLSDKYWLLTFILAGTVLIGFTKSVVGLWGRWIATRAVKQLQASLRRRAFDHAVRLPLHRVQELKSGGAASLLREDAGSVGELVFGLFYNPWRSIVQLLGSLAILAWVDWRLLLGGVAILPMVYFTHRTWISRIRPQHRAIRRTRQDIDARTTETFGGMRVVRAFGRQRSEATRFLRSNHLLNRQELHAWWTMRVVEIAWDLLIPLTSAALLWYGGRQVLAGQLSLGDLMMFLVYLLMLLEPLAVLAESTTTLQSSLAGLDRVLDLLHEPREFADAHPKLRIEKSQVRGDIEFENVTYRYPAAERDTLIDISFRVEAGETIALVGPSGAGKTTLCNLVARFYDPTQGNIRLDGRDIRDLELEDYRQLLGIVEQDVFLFDGTISENIAYGRRDATPAEIERAARIANAEDFILAWPNGYDTIIGERGVKLSGGQRQRIALARAVLADPKILILDEATSNLDSESEQLIQAGLQKLMRRRTCFVIAHRLSTIRHADRILVLEHGRLQQIGSHDELFETEGRYREMVEIQSGLRSAVLLPET